VGWQEEQRRLDEELAAGRVSPQEYRRRREELSKAENGQRSDPSPAPSGWNDDQPTTRMRREAEPTPAIGDDDQPTTRVHREAESTQAISGEDQPTTRVRREAESTQVIGDEDADPERTQVVPGAVGRAPQHQGPPVRSPWDEQALPPTTDVPPMWLKQGPEAFDQDSSTAKRVLGVVGVIAVLAGITVGAYFLFKPARGTNPPPATTTTATTAAATPTQNPLIAPLPGNASDMSSIKTFDDVRGIDYLTNGEASAYQAGGADQAAIALSDDGGARVIVLVTRQANANKAKTTRDALADLQVSAFKLTGRDGEPGVLIAASDSTSGGPLRRAHYSSKRYVVRIQVQGRDGDDVQSLFDDVLRAQLQRLPADPGT
jgi:hypothetical protein